MSIKVQRAVFQAHPDVHLAWQAWSLDFSFANVARGFLYVVGQDRPEVHWKHPLISKSTQSETNKQKPPTN